MLHNLLILVNHFLDWSAKYFLDYINFYDIWLKIAQFDTLFLNCRNYIGWIIPNIVKSTSESLINPCQKIEKIPTKCHFLQLSRRIISFIIMYFIHVNNEYLKICQFKRGPIFMEKSALLIVKLSTKPQLQLSTKLALILICSSTLPPIHPLTHPHIHGKSIHLNNVFNFFLL